MPSVTITADYDASVARDNGAVYSKDNNPDDNNIGYYSFKGGWIKSRACFRFNLENLPAGATVTQVRRRVRCNTAGGASHLIDDHAYGTNGQENPQSDGAQTCYNRCASGNLYQNDSSELRTTGVKWATLGGSVCADVEAAKAAVNYFALAMHEEGNNDPYALVDGHSKSGGTPPQLEITYEEGGASLSQTVSDTLTLGDSYRHSFSKKFSEFLNIASSTTQELLGGLSATVTDTITFLDSQVKDATKKIGETLSITESKIKNFIKSASDQLTLGDSQTKSFEKTQSENITLTDSQTKGVTKKLSDVLSIAETKIKGVSKKLSENITFMDSQAKGFIKKVADTITITSSTQAIKKIVQTVTDIINIVDAQRKVFTKKISDTISLVDNQTKTFRKKLSEIISITTSQSFIQAAAWPGIIMTLNLKERKLRLEIKK